MNLPEVINGLSQADLFELFRQQLRKDFEESGAEAQFTMDLPSDFGQLLECIARQLARIDKHSSSMLLNLLYRIDVNEKTFKLQNELNDGQNLYHAMAEQIIKRILQKVVLKKKFSQ